MASDSFSALNQFAKFDASAFLKGKILTAKSCSPLFDFKDGQSTDDIIGTKITVGILDDRTEYRPYPDGTMPDNSCKCFDVKLAGKMDVDIPHRSRIELVNPSGVVYSAQGSQRRDRISISADDVRIVQAKQ